VHPPACYWPTPCLDFGAYAAANATQYKQDSPQNISGYTLAMGERAVLPAADDHARRRVAGRAGKPVSPWIRSPSPAHRLSLADLRVSDEIAFGPFTLKPELSTTDLRFPAMRRRTGMMTART